MPKLIILSNRVGLPNSDKPVAGGLAIALKNALQENGGIWLGWNGEISNYSSNQDTCNQSSNKNSNKKNNQHATKFDHISQDNIEYITCPLTQKQYDQYYSGFANNTLWPALHSRADLIEYNAVEFDTYQQVNALFAKQLKQIANEDDVIWVHDYHFFSVAHYCRQLGMRNNIGFFLHIPFPSTTILKKIPSPPTLLQNLCQYDLVGLQTKSDEQQCMQALTSILKARKTQHTAVVHQQRVTNIKCYPIGVDARLIQQAAKKNMFVRNSVFDLDKIDQQKTIIGVDRIDYSKGLLERFSAFAAFLQRYPQYQKKITHLQIACPCRMGISAYQNLNTHLNQKIEQINQQFGRLNWQPIVCTQQTLDHEKVMAVYRQADICWISSLRDGMNLVAKEYIAAQNPTDPGVLILSKYAGAAEQMQAAIIVDPNDQNAMIAALKTAIDMPKLERIARYEKLMQGITAFDINDWRNSFLNDLSKNQQSENFNNPVKSLNSKHLAVR